MPVNPDDIDLIAARQVQVYKEAEVQILGIVRDHLARGVDSPTWANERLTALGSLRRATLRVLAKLRADRSGSFRAAVSEAYRNGRGSMLTDLGGATGQAAREAVKTVPRLDAIESLSAALIRDVGQREHNVLRNVEDVYRQVQAAAVARSIAGGITRREASQAAWQGFVDQGVTSFTDRGGRTWRLTTYVEMAVRTVSMRAAVQGQLDQLEELGVPLVIVSNESGECPRCRPFEGKVLARTGPFGMIEAKSVTTGQMITVDVMTTLDMARLAGLLHPNCRHVIRPFLPGATKIPAGPTEQPEQHKAREQQRAIERKIRGSKEQALAALTPEAKAKAEAKVRAYQAQMRQHIKDNPSLKRLPYREEIGAGNLPPGGKAPSPAGRLPGPPPPPKTSAAKKATGPQKAAPQTGDAALDSVPVKAIFKPNGTSDSSTWTATGFTGLPKADPGAVAAVTRYARAPWFVNRRLRNPSEPLHAQSLAELASGVVDTEKAAKAAALADRHIAALDRVMAQSRLPGDIVTYRGVRLDALGTLPGDPVGHAWTDPGFASTSTDRNVAEHSFAGGGSALLRIVAPKDTPALQLAGLGESEVLLGRGLTYRIVADRGLTPGGARLLDIEIVPVTAPVAPAKAVKKVAKKAVQKTAPPPPSKAAKAVAPTPAKPAKKPASKAVRKTTPPPPSKAKKAATAKVVTPAGPTSVRRPGRDMETEVRQRIYELDNAGTGGVVDYGDPGLTMLVSWQPRWGDAARVVSQADIDAAVSHGWTQMWRGVQASTWPTPIPHRDVAELARTGKWKMGEGIYGNGFYTSIRRTTAEEYRNSDFRPGFGGGAWGPAPLHEWQPGFDVQDGSLIRMALEPKARLAEYDTLQLEHQQWLAQQAGTVPEYRAHMMDIGWYAAMRGYDGMVVRGRPGINDGSMYPLGIGNQAEADQYVIFNRSVLLMERDDGQYDT